MSDTPQGPGWWQASDDKWYPPPRPDMPGEAAPPGSYPSEPPTAPVGLGGPPLGSGPGIPGATPSPYGGVPPVGAPPGGQNRTPLFVALGALGAAAIVLLVVLVASGGDDDDGDENSGGTTTTEADSPTTEELELPDVTAPEDDGDDTGGGGSGAGEVVVGETGFSTYYDELDEVDETTYAFYLENTGDQVATDVSVNVGLLDASGTVLDSESLFIGAIMPGAKMGIANSGFAAGVTTVDVQVSDDYGRADPSEYGEVTAEGVAIGFDSFNDPIITFTATSTYSKQLDSPSIYILFRDSSGKLIGGASGYSSNFIPANGSAAIEVETFDSISNFDPAKTEIYFDPGYF